MEHKGTEAPFSGLFNKHYDKGVYVCARCGAALFVSDAKFDSACGWPSFDSEISSAVKKLPDADGRRTEIVCARCEGHLGHVFYGEGFTPSDTRHCVNSVSLDFVPSANVERAVVAGGCFWGVEYLLKRLPGVLHTSCGYAGGKVPDPTYRQVCSKLTGHVEAVEVWFDNRVVSYTQVLRRFFEIHDFEQTDGQGPDIGPQYQSVVFFADQTQQKLAQELIEKLRAMGRNPATALRALEPFYAAEEYHQDYYDKNGAVPYCHARKNVFGN